MKYRWNAGTVTALIVALAVAISVGASQQTRPQPLVTIEEVA